MNQATQETAGLVSDIRLAVGNLSRDTLNDGPSDAALVHSWLGDWDTYLADRYAHVNKLRNADEDTPDQDLRFLVSDITAGGVYTTRMDGFARLNNMDACQVPGDI